jgi:hypothetical protein
MDETWAASVLLIIFCWFAYFVQGDRDYATRQLAVNNITYRYTQIASKKGELNEVIYDELERKLDVYGEFEIRLLAEKFEEDNTITRLEGDEVIGYDLRGNDFDTITIYAEAQKDHYLTTIFQMFPMNFTNARYRIVSQSAAYIE